MPPRRMVERDRKLVEFFWEPEIPKEEMPKGKKIAQQKAGRQKSLPTFAEDDQSSRLLLAGGSDNLIIF